MGRDQARPRSVKEDISTIKEPDPGPLLAIVGPGGVRQAASGRPILSPDSVERLLALIAQARAGGSKLALVEAHGAPFGRRDAAAPAHLLSLASLNRILEIDAPNLTCRVQAGVSHQELTTALKVAGVAWPVRPFPGHTTLAETVVTGLALTESLLFPELRHWLLGSSWALGAGAVVQAGGQTVKNSAGYDLTHALVGTLGEFAVPCELQLRLRPACGKPTTFSAPLSETLLEPMVRLHEAVQLVALVAAPGRKASTVIALAGSDSAIAAVVAEFNGSVIPAEAPEPLSAALEAIGRLATPQLVHWSAGPAAASAIIAAIGAARTDSAAVAFPAAGWGLASGPSSESLSRLIEDHGGSAYLWPPAAARLESLPAAGAESVFAALRRAFDPAGILV